jgi:hypothetical protein
VKFLAAIFPYLAKLKPIEREDGLKRIAGYLQERFEVVLAEYQSFQKNDKYIGQAIRESGESKKELNRMELNFVSHLVLFPETAEELKGIIDARMLESPEAKEILEYLAANPGKTTREIIATVTNPEIVNLVSEYAQSEKLRPELTREIAYKLKILYISREIARNAAQLRQYETETKTDEVKRLQQEKQELVAIKTETEKSFRDFEISE